MTVTVCRQPAGPLTSRFHIDDTDVTSSWQGYLWALADRLRCVVTEDPLALDALLAPRASARWLSPPLSDLVLVEEFLSALSRYGFTDRQAAAAYPIFFSCVLGLLRVATADTTDAPLTSLPATDDAATPMIHRLRPSLSEDHTREEYEDAVEAMLTRLERSLEYDES